VAASRERNKSRTETRTLQSAAVTAEAMGFPFAGQAARVRREVEGRQPETVALITSLPPERLDAAGWLRLNRRGGGGDKRGQAMGEPRAGASKTASTRGSTSRAATTNAACARPTPSGSTASSRAWATASSWSGAGTNPPPATRPPPTSPPACQPTTPAEPSPPSPHATRTSRLREYALHRGRVVETIIDATGFAS